MKHRNRGLGFFGAINASFEESWAEVKVNKARIFFSLFGVFVAVLALATVIGAGGMLEQSILEDQERRYGKEATITVNVHSENIEREDYIAHVEELIERYGLSAATRRANGLVSLQFSDGVYLSNVELYDYEFGVTRNILMQEGRWFTKQDEKALAPRIIINEWAWKKLGSPDLQSNPTVELFGINSGTAVIVGVTPDYRWTQGPEVILLYDDYTFAPWEEGYPPEYQFWVKPEIAEQLITVLEEAFNGVNGFFPSTNDQSYVSIFRTDAAGQGGQSPTAMITLLLSVIAGIILLIGGLGILNISMVTIKQRVREIGIRRSFGATKNRIFFTVMLESVAATFVAGLLGVIGSITILRNETLMKMFISTPIIDLPPYPIEAAVIGLGATLFVGALAGLIPALTAVRSNVIDAIRL